MVIILSCNIEILLSQSGSSMIGKSSNLIPFFSPSDVKAVGKEGRVAVIE